LFSGGLLEQNGGGALLVCQADQEMDAIVQVGRLEKREVWTSELESRGARPSQLGWVPASESSVSDVVEQRSGAQLDVEDESGMGSEQFFRFLIV
jgi:hypothetical protein